MRNPRVVPALLLALVAGCTGSEPSAPNPSDESSIRVTAFTAGTTIATLVVEVSAADIDPPLVFNLVVDEQTNTAAGTLKVRPGLARTFAVTAFDNLGEITHEGEATVDVSPGQNPPLQIKLGPRSGQVPVTISFGSFSVLVSPSINNLELPGTPTVQLTVQVLDEDAAPVADLTGLLWATTNPAIATVNATGLVTGLTAGSASIVATFEGVAGIALVNVAGVPVDADGDGFESDVDCDDSNVSVYPGAPEILDGLDNDCDGEPDDGLAIDADGDLFTNDEDCNDADASIYPGAPEVLNGIDDDCDGEIDEGLAVDNDLDGFPLPLDCDDSNAAINPGATEVFDGVDNDCDAQVDEGFDLDGDGFALPLDCDDTDATINPAAQEIPGDGKDNDCDALVDE